MPEEDCWCQQQGEALSGGEVQGPELYCRTFQGDPYRTRESRAWRPRFRRRWPWVVVSEAVGALERKQCITIRLLTSPPPPCGSLVKKPKRSATAETTSPSKITLDGIDSAKGVSGIGMVGLQKRNVRWSVWWNVEWYDMLMFFAGKSV